MARKTNDYNSASSQFFICHQDVTEHDGEYAAFGKIIEGWETLDKLADTAVYSGTDIPRIPPEIMSIRFVYPD
jgi:peptidylprolyl isomerase/peptidyl-prolyl cis-trans isomerase B (cyclophilin B)